MNIESWGWIIGIVVVVAVTLYVYRVTVGDSKDRLMRCPETGLITLVGIGPALPTDSRGREIAVERCKLWPEKAGCAQGCLERYAETSDGFPVNTIALRPFERR